MSNFWDSIYELLTKLFGSNSSDQRRLKALDGMETHFISARRDNEDNLHSLKDEIKAHEARALKKKQELEQTHGDSKRIVVGEIERIFRELDLTKGRESIVAANLERISQGLAKVREAKAALQAGINEDQFDEIAVEIEDLFSTLKASDRAAADMNREEYAAPETSSVNVDERLESVEGQGVASVDLSPEMQARFKALETE
jgi:hypothetical protein